MADQPIVVFDVNETLLDLEAIRPTFDRESRSMPSSPCIRRIVKRLKTNPGVRPENVMIWVVDTAAENWSFGNGETRFYNPAERQVAVA